jgi:hypothetical protein
MQFQNMKQLIIGGLVGAALTASITGLVFMTSEPERPLKTSSAQPEKPSSQGVLDMICELKLDLDGQLALGITANEPNRMAMAQVDFDKASGWYQGRIAISESRAGNLSIVGNKLKVSRPAMFERFGVKITREEFVIDRTTGDFQQALTLQDGRNISLIKGTCARVIKPAF